MQLAMLQELLKQTKQFQASAAPPSTPNGTFQTSVAPSTPNGTLLPKAPETPKRKQCLFQYFFPHARLTG